METYVCLGELFASVGRKETHKILRQNKKTHTKKQGEKVKDASLTR